MPASNLSSQTSLAYYGAILGAAQGGASTQDVWAAVRATSEALGGGYPLPNIQDVSRMRSAASSEINSARALAKAGPDQRVESTMIGLPPYARDANERQLSQRWQVNFQHITSDEDGGLATEWKTVMFGTMNMTVGELNDRIGNAAQAMADKYNTSHVGVGDIFLNER